MTTAIDKIVYFSQIPRGEGKHWATLENTRFGMKQWSMGTVTSYFTVMFAGMKGQHMVSSLRTG